MAATGIAIRPLTSDDAGAVAALAAADEEAFRGEPSRLQPTDVLAWWERTDLARDSWLYEDAGGPVAVGWFELWGEIGMCFGIVAQGAKGRGFGASLLERAEARARERGAARAHTWALEQDAAAAALFRSHGFSEVRRFYEMAIELDAAPPAPSLREGLVVDEFQEEDAHAFHAATIEAFQDHWDWHGVPFEEWWELRRGQQADADGPLWFLVRDGDEIAAVARNEANRNGGGYVGALGVRRPWRGQGLGKALLHRTFGEFWGRGVPRVTLGVDAENPTGATKLYESVGMEVESAAVVFEKALA
jgi:mycothiol synthase